MMWRLGPPLATSSKFESPNVNSVNTGSRPSGRVGGHQPASNVVHRRAFGMRSSRRAMALGPEHALIQTLRLAGNEPQLTQVIVALAQADQSFARALLSALLASTVSGRRLDAMRQSAQMVECHGERQLFDASGRPVGRIDVVLEGPDIALFVELKLHSDYGLRQLERYARGIRPDRGERLMAVTRNIPRFLEPPRGTPGWLGSVRWSQLIARCARSRPAAAWLTSGTCYSTYLRKTVIWDQRRSPASS